MGDEKLIGNPGRSTKSNEYTLVGLLDFQELSFIDYIYFIYII